jgi:hypothetical protein
MVANRKRGRLLRHHRNLLIAAAVLLAVPACPLLQGQSAGYPKPLMPYTTCSFPDGLQVTALDALPTEVRSRTVETADGKKQIDMTAGVRVMFAYPFTDFYANAKVEELPAAEYPALKRELVDNLAFITAHSPGTTMNEALPAALHGFEAYGNDRGKLEGGVLGMYLLFDDLTHVATTVYFLNQASWQRKFQTWEGYEKLRDQFLIAYTGCVRQNQALGR